MFTYTGLQTAAKDGANDVSTDGLTFLKSHINAGYHFVEDELGSFYTEETKTASTEASTGTYEAPARYLRFKHVYITVSSIRYTPEVIYDEQRWQRIMSWQGSQTSDIPIYIFARKSTYEIYPKPATAGNTITMIYEASNKDLTKEDYTTGTITTLANAGTSVTGASSAWNTTSNVVAGEYFKINIDGTWYKIASVSSDTALTLTKKYEGTSIAAGTALYTIGEVPNLPESTQILPAYYALSQYYLLVKVDNVKSKDYWDMFMGQNRYKGGGLIAAKSRWGKRTSSRYMIGQRIRRREARINPNYYPGLVT